MCTYNIICDGLLNSRVSKRVYIIILLSHQRSVIPLDKKITDEKLVIWDTLMIMPVYLHLYIKHGAHIAYSVIMYWIIILQKTPPSSASPCRRRRERAALVHTCTLYNIQTQLTSKITHTHTISLATWLTTI